MTITKYVDLQFMKNCLAARIRGFSFVFLSPSLVRFDPVSFESWCGLSSDLGLEDVSVQWRSRRLSRFISFQSPIFLSLSWMIVSCVEIMILILKRFLWKFSFIFNIFPYILTLRFMMPIVIIFIIKEFSTLIVVFVYHIRQEIRIIMRFPPPEMN